MALLAGGFASCDDSTDIGTSIITDKIDIIVDSSFVISTSATVEIEDIQSRTIQQLIGIIDSKEFGYMKSDVVCQFMPSNALDTANVDENTGIDSLHLIMSMAMGSYVGDSIVPMGLKVYGLDKQLPSPIYSDFDPKGYYSESNCLGSAVYNASALGRPDSIAEGSTRNITVKLPTSLGYDLFKEYRNNPESFASPSAFAKIFPGVYIENTFGSGRMVSVGKTIMRMYYHTTVPIEGAEPPRDTTYYRVGNYFAVTPEVITNNNITLEIAQYIREKAAQGEKLLLAPAGYEVSFKFPADKIIDVYREKSGKLSILNTLSLALPAEEIANDLGIEPPADVLLIPTAKKDEFFANNELPDGKMSFVASYNEGKYTFPDMRDYITELMGKETVEAQDLEFSIIPVTITKESNTYGNLVVVNIAPYVSKPAMAKIEMDKAKIIFTFSKRTTNF